MHDLDRIMTEMESNGSSFEFAEESQFPGTANWGGVLTEAEEMELAAELLGVADEAELDQFIGGLFKKIGRGIGKFVKSPIGRSLGGILKGVAKKALPMVGGALGSFIPIPGVGTAVGTALGSAASRLFEMELEGMEPEDQEFEVARRFVRFAGEAVKNAAMTPSNMAPQAAARAAIASAAQQFAPGLLRQAAPPAVSATPGSGRSGRWIRRGGKIVLLGV